MPDPRLLEYTPRNTWVHISEGNCERCSRPRDLYTNSVVPHFVVCTQCILQAAADLCNSTNRVLANADTAEAVDAAADVHYQMMSDYHDIRDKYDREYKPVWSEGRCSGCYHPIIEGAQGSYSGVVSYDKDMNELRSHMTCSYFCDDCDKYFISWNSNSAGIVIYMSFEKYLGMTRCEPCVKNIIEEWGGEDRFIYCEQCESMEDRSESRTFNHSRYCGDCYNDCVRECDNCSEEYWHSDDHDCNDVGNLIHEYDYRPRPHFFGEGKYHFGFELEVESNHDSRREGAEYVINRLGSHAYLKRDGSLNNGFEIVTHPHTLDEYQKKFNWSCMNGLSERGYRSWHTRTCGLHVHVSRTAFGVVKKREDVLKAQSHELRFIKLIYDNQRQIQRLAGRSSSYAKFNDKGNLAARVKYGTQDDRYEAVNSQNSETLEVRVFKGSLKPARILSAIELVHASVEYTRDLKVTGSNRALQWIKFVRFVADNETTYPNLVPAIQRTFDLDTEPQSDDDDND